MTKPVANYTFLPWLRQGIARQITAADGDNAVKLRATVPVELEITAEGGPSKPPLPVNRSVQIYGPGDVVGVDSKAIVRTEPRDWVTNFEPNYLAFIEFYDEDFPWRYTPAAPNGNRLRPWMMLVVLEESEFAEGKNLQDRPLPFIQVSDAAAKFPPLDELWAWTHVHVNGTLDGASVVSTNRPAIVSQLENLLKSNPDLACSRIMCPRQLEPSKSYHAFLVPAFESGRLSGLGLKPEDAPFATASALDAYNGRTDGELFPYYHRWRFHTSTVGDFEYLVRLLKPQPIDVRVGRRDMDVSDPDANLPALDDPKVDNILRLGGALRVPVKTMKKEDKDEFDKYEDWALPMPHPWQQKLAALLNLADDYQRESVAQAHNDPELEIPDEEKGDPLITPPIYGQWHALTKRLLVNPDGTPVSKTDNWVHELNLDPRFRVPAGFGTKVVQDNQELYMDAAWNQIGRVLEGNRRIRWGQLSEIVSASWHDRIFQVLAEKQPERMLLIAAPVQKRVMNQGFTMYHTLQNSIVPAAALSAPLRRAIRPGGRLVRSLPFSAQVRPGNLVARLNAGQVVVALPKTVSPAVLTLAQAVQAVTPKNIPGFLVNWLRKHPWVKYVPIGIALLFLLLLFIFSAGVVWLAIGAAVLGGSIFLYRLLAQWEKELKAVETLKETNQTPAAVEQLPKSPNFRLSDPAENFQPNTGGADSVEAVRFKKAIADMNELFQVSIEAAPDPAVRPTLQMPALATAVAVEIQPRSTIPARVLSTLFIPQRLKDLLVEHFDDVMDYPIFDQPMYEPLKNISSELFLPNIHLIAQNSISLLETNQKFIEAYMVGLNHEFARELLWREYPTDQRGSYFRQFWDVKGYFPPDTKPTKDQQEELRDIPELHTWSLQSTLGAHDNREIVSGAKEEEVVLVIRGELLKKYPNTVVYAHKADWVKKDDGANDRTEPRILRFLSDSQETKPPLSIIRTPLYEAQVQPDIYFFGFDLTAEAAQGGAGENPAVDDAGWFFVLKERPGEPRFGLDTPIENAGIPSAIDGWNDLAWKPELLKPGTPHLKAVQNVSLAFTEPDKEDNGQINPVWEQYNEDLNVHWTTAVSAAELAYILYQVPVMVAVHAAEMLPKKS